MLPLDRQAECQLWQPLSYMPAPHLVEQHVHHQVVCNSVWLHPGVLPEAECVLDGLPFTHGHHVKDVVVGLKGQRDSLCRHTGGGDNNSPDLKNI